jgi:hypothetical protein
MEKTNTSKSPLLKPVIERDYTKGLNLTDPDIPSGGASSPPPGQPKPETGTPPPSPPPPPGQKFNIPPDETKAFTFDEMQPEAGDIDDADSLEGVNISSASAKTFANFVGDAIQMYLPKLTYGYSKIDIENVIVNIEKGTLTANWLDAFSAINKNTEDVLQITDDAIKMWKKAFKDYLESENIAFANPKTALLMATVVLLADQGVRAYQIRKSNEEYMRQALEKSNPYIFDNKPPANPPQPEPNKNDNGKQAA